MIKIPVLPKLSISFEYWKWNDEFNIYVSNKGGLKDNLGRNIEIKINSGGYSVIKTDAGLKSVHRLVMLTFRPRSNSAELTVDHLNHNKRDNSLKNLEWCTMEENTARAAADIIVEPKSKKVNVKKYITNGVKKFDSAEMAAKWVLKYTGNDLGTCPSAKLENVIRRINTALNGNKKYCGFDWKIKEEI